LSAGLCRTCPSDGLPTPVACDGYSAVYANHQKHKKPLFLSTSSSRARMSFRAGDAMFDPRLLHSPLYLKTTSLLSAEKDLLFPDSSRVHCINGQESSDLARILTKRNVFMRHQTSRNHYVKRVEQLADRTVIEVFADESLSPRLPNEELVQFIEELVIVSTALVMRKGDLMRRLGVRRTGRHEFNLTIWNQHQNVRSQSDRLPQVAKGVTMNQSFCARFAKCGFHQLFEYCQASSDLPARVRRSLHWLCESRREASLTASAVKRQSRWRTSSWPTNFTSPCSERGSKPGTSGDRRIQGSLPTFRKPTCQEPSWLVPIWEERT
jgi:hypothetical protein